MFVDCIRKGIDQWLSVSLVIAPDAIWHVTENNAVNTFFKPFVLITLPIDGVGKYFEIGWELHNDRRDENEVLFMSIRSPKITVSLHQWLSRTLLIQSFQMSFPRFRENLFGGHPHELVVDIELMPWMSSNESFSEQDNHFQHQLAVTPLTTKSTSFLAQ